MGKINSFFSLLSVLLFNYVQFHGVTVPYNMVVHTVVYGYRLDISSRTHVVGIAAAWKAARSDKATLFASTFLKAF